MGVWGFVRGDAVYVFVADGESVGARDRGQRARAAANLGYWAAGAAAR